jgi:hypothetical protein
MKDAEKVDTTTLGAQIMECAPTIRELMPAGFTTLLCKRTGSKNIPNMSMVVSLENTASKYWPAILELAKQTNPEGFAKWEAARAQPA